MRREDCQARHERMAGLKADGLGYRRIGRILGCKPSTVVHHLKERCACYPKRAWRSASWVRERQAYIVEVADENPGITLMEIALKAFERFGNPETGKPLHYSTIIHHLRIAGFAPGVVIRRRTASTAPATKSPTEI